MTYTDFLSDKHAINGHWNDAPKKALKSTHSSSGDSLSQSFLYNQIITLLTNINTTPLQLKKVQDIKKRLEPYSNENGIQLSGDTLIIWNNILNEIKNMEFNNALELHKELVMIEDTGNAKWLVGMKRFIELMKEVNV